MSDRKRNILLDDDFDLLLSSVLPDTPPENIADSVTPWKKAMDRVVIGFAMSAVTFNFALLNYILPAIGMVLVLLGFRALRRENRFFTACYAVTFIRAAYFFPLLVLNTTIYQSAFYASSRVHLLTVLNLVLQFVQYYCLWRALKEVKQKADLEPDAASAAWLMVWHVVTCVLGLIHYSGWLIFIGMIAAYICIVRSLLKSARELDEAGYAICAAPVRLTDRALVIIIAVVFIGASVCGYVFGNSYKMDWTPRDTAEHSEAEAVKSHLLELGFPEYVLCDLTEEEILACDGAKLVVHDVMDHPINPGRRVEQKLPAKDGSSDIRYEITTVYDKKELRITGVAVLLPCERETWMIFQHFLWTENPGFFGTECIQLWPPDHFDLAWSTSDTVSGRLLYDCDGETYVSPYHSLGRETYESNPIFFGKSTRTDIFAAFSLPNRGSGHRGYISYSVEEMQDGWIMDCWINYLHHGKYIEYPAYTAIERRKNGSWSADKVYKLVQDALQFYPYDRGAQLIN